MEFRIADTFTDSLGRLTGDEQKAVKTTAFDLQLNPANPGMSFHKLDKVRDKNFWSVRVSSDIRLIVHRSEQSLLLCYVDHHDKAYEWAARRKLETHPKTGAAQLVEIRETVQEIFVPVYVQEDISKSPVQPSDKPMLFAHLSGDELLGYGVPVEWLNDVKLANEDTLLNLADHLPSEAAEALLELATGGNPRTVSPPIVASLAMRHEAASSLRLEKNVALSVTRSVPPSRPKDPFDHPDAQRRFRTIANVEELQLALDYPWDKWAIFLHPEQRDLVSRNFNGPARVLGSAGTGKTIVAIHRAGYLARSNPDARVLLTTFSDTLAYALRTKMRRLASSEPRLAERIDVYSLNAIGFRLYKANAGSATIASPDVVREVIRKSASMVSGHSFSQSFLRIEWEQVVDAWQLQNWESYRDVARLGRKTRLPEAQRRVLWSIFEQVRADLRACKLITYAELFTVLAAEIAKGAKKPFDFAVVDEAQDLTPAQLRLLAALGGGRSNALFFAGDLGQRIFQQPFSWKSLGVDVRGRSRTLRINYRTSHQIRTQADRLLGPSITDFEGSPEDRNDTVSTFNGPIPEIREFADADEEGVTVGNWIATRLKEGVQPHEIGVFVRSNAELERARSALAVACAEFRILDDHVETSSGYVSISTMHLAKGLEFRAVAVIACDDEIIPLQERIETVGDDADLQEVYDTERHLLYVACTRARDYLLVSGVKPVSEFLDDLR